MTVVVPSPLKNSAFPTVVWQYGMPIYGSTTLPLAGTWTVSSVVPPEASWKISGSVTVPTRTADQRTMLFPEEAATSCLLEPLPAVGAVLFALKDVLGIT